jgi:hypothetical protein
MAYVRCPECRHNLHVEFLPWLQPTPILRDALVSHLIEEH